ncbi:MAG: hypothetical protein V5A59_14195 [Bacteroidales bacterium]|nr:hypothetical protein [Bacteroidales bacterium]
MPIFAEPTNDEARLGFLKRAVVTAAYDKTAGNSHLTEQTENDVTEFIPLFEGAIKRINDSLSKRTVEVQEGSEALEDMKTATRDFWEVVRRRVKRLDQPAGVLTYYELPLSGLTPRPTTIEEWFILADKIIDGDAKAVAAGYPAMENPDAEELKAARDKALAERRDIPIADRIYDEAQAELEGRRPRAIELIDDIMADLRHSLRKMDGPSQRRIMRSYGATFKYYNGEPEDEIPETDTE